MQLPLDFTPLSSPLPSFSPHPLPNREAACDPSLSPSLHSSLLSLASSSNCGLAALKSARALSAIAGSIAHLPGSSPALPPAAQLLARLFASGVTEAQLYEDKDVLARAVGECSPSHSLSLSLSLFLSLSLSHSLSLPLSFLSTPLSCSLSLLP